VLYDVDRRVIASLLTGTVGPSTVDSFVFEERLAALLAEPRPDTEELRNRALRHTLTRRLLEEPVVYYDDLSPDELAYLRSQRADRRPHHRCDRPRRRGASRGYRHGRSRR
jgi:uncharacterized protein (TIGR02678 family)